MKQFYMSIVIAVFLILMGCRGTAEPVPFEAAPEQVMPDEEKEKTADTEAPGQAQSETPEIKDAETVPQAQEQIKPTFDFSFDLSDKEIVSVSSGTGGTEWKGSDVAVSTLKVEKLSDVFYDGFNYIDYINRKILKLLARRMAYDYNYDTAGDEFIQKRAFSGIPRDYPYFVLQKDNGMLGILFLKGNPFFSGEYYNSDGSFNLAIELSKDISPYGSEKVDKAQKIDYEKFVTEEGLIVLKPTVHDYVNETADEAINSAAAELAERIRSDKTVIQKIKADLESDNVKMDGFQLQPEFGSWKNYLCVNYVIDLFGGPYPEAPFVAGAAVDISTGERVDLVKMIPKDFDWSKCAFGSDLNGGAPIKPSEFIDAWIRYDSYLCVNYVTADGTKGLAVIPLEELK